MNSLLAILILVGCFLLMGIGLLLAKKTLKRGCSLGPECTCKNDPQKSPEECDNSTKTTG